MGVDIMEKFIEKIESLIKQRGTSRAKLSSLIGRSMTYVNQLVKGQIKSVDYDTAYKMLFQLGYGSKEEINSFIMCCGIFIPEFPAKVEMKDDANKLHIEGKIEELVKQYIKNNLTIETKEIMEYDSKPYIEIKLTLDGEEISTAYIDK
jgi:predicted XRE-type DNA-binding protein